jgi:hypothetical protein
MTSRLDRPHERPTDDWRPTRCDLNGTLNSGNLSKHHIIQLIPGCTEAVPVLNLRSASNCPEVELPVYQTSPFFCT